MSEICRLCQVVADREDSLCETDRFMVHVDKNPATPGHVLVVSKRHVVSLFELADEEWNELRVALSMAVQGIMRLDKRTVYAAWLKARPHDESVPYWERALRHAGIDRRPDGFNIGNNEGKAAGRSIDHLHIHILPRYSGDTQTPEGGVRNVIPGEGYFNDSI